MNEEQHAAYWRGCNDCKEMAQEAGWTGIYSQWVSPTEREHLTVPVTMEQIERFATIVAAAEREACAKVCDTADKSTHPADLADAIRARGPQ